MPLVAFDINYLPLGLDRPGHSAASLLILCVETRCLIVQLLHTSPLPESIIILFSDENVYFVGTPDRFYKLEEWAGMHGCGTVVKLYFLAFGVFSRPDFLSVGLVQLARELIKLRLEECTESGTFSDWGAGVFLYDQVKFVIQDAYASYQIANLLFHSGTSSS